MAEPRDQPGHLLREHTTLRLGGPAKEWVRAESEAELIEAVTAADSAGEPLFVLGRGSNLVVADEGFDGTLNPGIEQTLRAVGAAYGTVTWVSPGGGIYGAQMAFEFDAPVETR